MRGWLAAGAAALSLLAAGRGSCETAPLEAFGALPSVSDVVIDHEGMQVAMLVSDGQGRQVQVRTVDHKPELAVDVGDMKVRRLQWVDANHLLILVSTASYLPGFYQAHNIEMSKGLELDIKTHHITPLLENMTQKSLSVLSGDEPFIVRQGGREVMFVQGVSFPTHQGEQTLWRINPDSGFPELISIGADDTYRFVVDSKGELVARADYHGLSNRWTLMARRGAGWAQVYTQIALIDLPEIVGAPGDGTVLLRLQEDGHWRVHALTLQSGSLGPAIEDLTDKAPVLDPATRVVIGSAHDEMKDTVYSFLSPHDEASWMAVKRAFPGDEVRLVSWSDDRKRIVAVAEGPKVGAAYFVVDLTKGTAAWLADEYTAIGPDDVQTQRTLTYRAADGRPIQAYLTLPNGQPAHGLPAVVLVHGGPAARDRPGFDWWSQALASQGYAVLQPEYRGSSGLEPELLTAGYGQWGRKMQSDLADGVRALAAEGVIDPARVCIVGASYGGYAALAGAAFDGTTYRCAVSLAGPADLRAMLDYERGGSGSSDIMVLRYWDRFMGARSPGDRSLDDISPARHADKVAIPVLLIHGKDDTVVPYAQSQAMADALRRAGKPTQLVTLNSEDHWLSRSATRQQMLKATVDFLQAHDPSGGPSAPAAKTAAAGS